MNWISFSYGALASAVAFIGTSASVSYYFMRHPQKIMRHMMKKRTEQIRKAA